MKAVIIWPWRNRSRQYDNSTFFESCIASRFDGGGELRSQGHSGSGAGDHLHETPVRGGRQSQRLETIEGRATGAHPGDKVVLYANSGVWWIQPFADRPFTEVKTDSTWSNRTHPGFTYAALLVKEGYKPRVKTDVLPEKGGAVLAVTQTEGLTRRWIEKNLLFAGYQWQVREVPSNAGGSTNDFDPSNAWTDARGLLHLRIAGQPDHWTCAEVSLNRSLGYGSYRFVVRDVSHLEPSAVFTMSTWDGSGPYREMDIEISKWGETSIRNGQFVIQPYHVPANTVQFETPAGPATFMLRWSPGRASFKALRGAVSRWDAPGVREHVFTSGVPPAGKDSVRMQIYVFGRNSHPLRRGAEVLVENFEYLP